MSHPIEMPHDAYRTPACSALHAYPLLSFRYILRRAATLLPVVPGGLFLNAPLVRECWQHRNYQKYSYDPPKRSDKRTLSPRMTSSYRGTSCKDYQVTCNLVAALRALHDEYSFFVRTIVFCRKCLPRYGFHCHHGMIIDKCQFIWRNLCYAEM